MGSYECPTGRKFCSTLSSPNNGIFVADEESPFLFPLSFSFDLISQMRSMVMKLSRGLP